jgi:cytochrome c
MKHMRWILLAASVAGAPAAWADAVDDAMTKAGCAACHAADKKVVGPSFKEVAAKRKGDAGAVALLMDKVRKGGSGVYGPVPMPPTGPDKISDADLKGAIEKMLKS